MNQITEKMLGRWKVSSRGFSRSEIAKNNNYGKWMKGRKVPPKVLEKIIKANTGKKRSEEFKERMRKLASVRFTRVKFSCDFCKKQCEIAPSLFYPDKYHRRENHFCSQECNAKWMKFVRKTEDHPLYKGIGDKNAKLYRERGKINNPNYYKVKRDNSVIYRVRRRGLGGKITKQEWLDIKRDSDYRCKLCKKQEPEIKLVADHIIPVVKWEQWVKDKQIEYMCGDKENIQALCISCNCKKSSKLPNFHEDVRKLKTLTN